MAAEICESAGFASDEQRLRKLYKVMYGCGCSSLVDDQQQAGSRNIELPNKSWNLKEGVTETSCCPSHVHIAELEFYCRSSPPHSNVMPKNCYS